MSDETTDNGPEGEVPAGPPLRAVFMVWPGQVHGQTWMFLWLGVTYLLGSLLPWHGPNDVEYVLEKPFEIEAAGSDADGAPIPAKTTNVLSAVHYEMARDNAANHDAADPGAIAAVRDPTKPFGQTIILLCAIAMVVVGATNIWNRRLSMTATLCTWFIALAVLYFTTGSQYAVAEGGGYFREPNIIKGFTQIGDTMGAVFGNFTTVIDGRTNDSMRDVFSCFGMGFYMTMLAQLFLIVFIVFSIVSGMMTAKPGDPAASSGGSAARRARPGSSGAGFGDGAGTGRSLPKPPALPDDAKGDD